MPAIPIPDGTNDTDNEVAREVFGVGTGYLDLSGNTQADFISVGEEAFRDVTAIAKWYAEATGTHYTPADDDLNTDWNELFRVTWIAKCHRRWRSGQDFHAYMGAVVLPVEERVREHYTGSWDTADVTADDSITPVTMRRSAMMVLVRQRTPVYAPIPEIDRTMREEFQKLWNYRRWEYRKRLVEVTLTTDGDVLVDGGWIYDGMASKWFTVEGASGGRKKCKWTDATRIADIATYYDGETGRPEWFYDEDHGATKKIHLFPLPDESYTARVVINIGTPEFGGEPDGLSLLPPEFRGHLRDSVVSKLMGKWGREDVDAERMRKQVVKEREELAQKWDDKGSSRSMAVGHHHMRMPQDLASYSGRMILGPQ
jgi:hypothetical protein